MVTINTSSALHGRRRQTKEQHRARQKLELQALYRQFIQDASKLTPSALDRPATTAGTIELNRHASLPA
jgi:hypothetical protein